MNSNVNGSGVGMGVVQKTTLQFLPKIVTFEHRHENKSCLACPEDQLKLFKISNFQIFKNFQIFCGSQLLSDFLFVFWMLKFGTESANGCF